MIHQAAELTDKIGKLWCRLMHDSVSWPVHRQYHCRMCMRQHEVPWAGDATNISVIKISAAASERFNRLQRAA